MPDQALRELLDKQAIRDVLSCYCRGLDRMDKEMARRVWWDGGTANYDGIYEGTGHGFIDWVWEVHSNMDRHSHQITNVLIELDGDRATSEAYVTVALWPPAAADGGQTELVGRGRYLDRWERRGEVWAIAHRLHLLDMSSAIPVTRAAVSAGSTRDERDAAFDFMTPG